MRQPGRFVGLHFFNPVHRMPLVEVVCSEVAEADAVGCALSFVHRLGKVPVKVADSPGFLVNCSHILGAYNALGKEETSGELKVIPRSAHGYRYRFSAEMDLARLLHRHSVVNFRHLPSIDLRHRAFDCGVVQESTSQDATVMLRKHGPGRETAFC